ncbi:MAG: hypothetical protein ACRDA4_03940 [Filifactoraceae bacterium]
MKKNNICILLIVFFLLIISLFTFFKFQNNILTVQNHPLDINVVESALESSGLSWTAEKQEPVIEGKTIYYLSKDDELIGSIISGVKNGETFLNVSASLYYNNGYSLPKNEWEKFIIFSTILNGGFKNKHQIYDVFSKEYDNINITKSSRNSVPINLESIYKRSLWEKKINDYYVQITLNKPDINYSEEYLNTIIISTNLDTFVGK